MRNVYPRFFYTAALLALAVLSLSAQIGGKHIYKFVDLPITARVTALGSQLLSVADYDVGLSWNNPALINGEMQKRLAFQYNFHLAQTGSGYVGYADTIPFLKSIVAFGAQFVQYGDFQGRDEFSNPTGPFKANELAFQIGIGRQIFQEWRVGANLKVISSQLETYQSTGLSADVGLYRENEEKRSSMAVTLNNVGYQLTTYAVDEREKLPFDLRLGFSKRFKYLPLRLSTVIHHLHRWNLLFDVPDSDIDNNLFSDGAELNSRFGDSVDNFFRHFIFNGEFLLGQNENLVLRFGYNHLRKREMEVVPYRSIAGFSAGFSFSIKSFQISYGFGSYHLAGSNNHIGINASLDKILGNKKVNF